MRWAVALALGLAACSHHEAKPAPPPGVRISIAWSGAMPGEVDREIVPRVEAALAQVPGITEVRSHAIVERATIDVTGPADVEAIRKAMAAAQAELPSGVDPPVIERVEASAAPVMVAIVDERRAEGGERLRALEATPGLRVRDTCGGEAPELVVTVDPVRASAAGLSLGDVAAQLERAHVDEPAGRVDGAGRVRTMRRHDDAAALGAIEVATGVKLSDLAEIHSGPAAGCRATLDGKPATIAVVERARGAALPPGTRVLDGPALEGELVATAEQYAHAIGAMRAAIMPPRWFVTRFDPDRERLTISIGLAPGTHAADVAAAIDAAAGSMGHAGPARWSGGDLVVATAIVRGPDARDAGPRLAAALRATAGVAAAGCDPCASHATETLHMHDTRLAAIGARAADVTRLAAIARGGLVLATEPPVRLTVPDDVDVTTLTLRTDSAGLVPLGDFLTVEAAQLPSAYLRVDREPAVELWARAAPGTSLAKLRTLVAAQAR